MNRLFPTPDDSLEATGLARLRHAGWSLGQWAAHNAAGGVVWIVAGTNGEKAIRGERATQGKAWGWVVEQAKVLGMLGPANSSILSAVRCTCDAMSTYVFQ